MYDVIIVVILIMSLVLGLKKGFIKTTCSMFSLILSSLLVYFLYDYFLAYFSSSAGGEIVTKYVTENYNGIFADKIAATMVSTVALVLLYFISKVLLKFLIGVLDIMSKLPIINLVNKALGGAVGLIFGIVLVIIITNIAFVIPSVSPYIEESIIVDTTQILFVSIN